MAINRIKNIREDDPRTMKFSDITDDSLRRELMEYNYKKIIRIVNSPGDRIKLFFQTYPTGPKRVSEVIKAVASEYKIKTIDQDVVFSKVMEIESLVSCDGWHLNAKGYNLMAKNIYEEFLKEGIISNKLTRDIHIREKEVHNEIFRLNENTWEYDLSKIAKHPEKLIFGGEGGWCFLANNIVDLPKIELMSGEYSLQIQAKGTPVNDIYPLVGFYYKLGNIDVEFKRNELNKIYVNGDWKKYFSKKIIINDKQNITFYISFENDALEIKDGQVSDRNLYINKIILRSLSK